MGIVTKGRKLKIEIHLYFPFVLFSL